LGDFLRNFSACDALVLGLSVSSVPEQVALDCLRYIEDEVIHRQEAISCLEVLETSLSNLENNFVETSAENKFRFIHRVTKHVTERLLARSTPRRDLERCLLQIIVQGINSLGAMRKGSPSSPSSGVTNSSLPRADVEIIDLLLLSTWPKHLHLHLIQAIFAIEPLLKKRHSSLVQVSRSCNNNHNNLS